MTLTAASGEEGGRERGGFTRGDAFWMGLRARPRSFCPSLPPLPLAHAWSQQSEMESDNKWKSGKRSQATNVTFILDLLISVVKGRKNHGCYILH